MKPYDVHLNRFFPKNTDIIYAYKDTVTDQNKKNYINYYNDSLRWLAGYDNPEVNAAINSLMDEMKNTSLSADALMNRAQSQLLKSAPNFSHVYFQNNSGLKLIYEALCVKDRRFLIVPDAGSLHIPESLKDTVLYFDTLLRAEPESRKPKNTEEGYDVKQIEAVLKRYKNRIAGFVVTPLMLSHGRFLSKDTIEILSGLLKKNRIPLIMDESLTAFWRSGSYFWFDTCGVVPDIVMINANLFRDQKINLVFVTKKIEKKYFKQPLQDTNNACVPQLLVLTALLSYLDAHNMKDHVKMLHNRLSRKLRALESNTYDRFHYRSKGLITWLDVGQENLARRLQGYLLDNGSALLRPAGTALLMNPPLIIDESAVDAVIDQLDTFFRHGLRLPMAKDSKPSEQER